MLSEEVDPNNQKCNYNIWEAFKLQKGSKSNTKEIMKHKRILYDWCIESSDFANQLFTVSCY